MFTLLLLWIEIDISIDSREEKDMFWFLIGFKKQKLIFINFEINEINFITTTTLLFG